MLTSPSSRCIPDLLSLTVEEPLPTSVDHSAREKPNRVVTCAKRAASLIWHSKLKLYALEGEFEGGPLRVLVADDGATLSYIRRIVFPAGAGVSGRGAISAFAAPRLAEADSDLVVVGANHLLLDKYTRRGFYVVPKWVRLVLPLDAHPDTLVDRLGRKIQNDVRRTLRRMKEAGFAYRVTTDPDWFDRFYCQMYRPFALRRYGELAVVRSYRRVKGVFLSGAGIAVARDGEDVAGEVVCVRSSALCSSYMGTLNGDESIAREGASQALYCCDLVLAHSLGCREVDFGAGRPFVSDGVLRYKLKWGSKAVYDDYSTAAFAIAAPRRSEQAVRFLAANRFFHLVGERLELL